MMMCRWFRYGVLGRRMTESFSNGLVYHRNFWYDGQMVIYEESDGVKYRYYNGNLIDEVLCREDQFGGQIWYLTDALGSVYILSLIHISEPTRPRLISYAVFCLKKKK